MQDTIVCLTMEAKYNALLMGMRDLLPICYLVKEIVLWMNFGNMDVSNICKTIVHKDNQGCLKLANLEAG